MWWSEADGTVMGIKREGGREGRQTMGVEIKIERRKTEK